MINEKSPERIVDPNDCLDYEELRKEYAIEDKSKHATKLRTACQFYSQ